MNRKGQVAEILVDVWSYIVWMLIILVFILLLNLRACSSGHAAGESTLKGQLIPEILENDVMLSYLQTSVKDCSANNLQLDVTPPELIILFMKGDPRVLMERDFRRDTYMNKFEDEKYAVYSKIWYECTRENLIHGFGGDIAEFGLFDDNNRIFTSGVMIGDSITAKILTEEGDLEFRLLTRFDIPGAGGGGDFE